MKRVLIAAGSLLAALPLAAQPLASDAQFFSALGAGRAAILSRQPGLLPAVPKAAGVPVDPVEEAVSRLLAGSGVPQAYVDAAFADPRKHADPRVPPQISKPGEALPYPEYRKIFLNPRHIDGGVAFYRAHQALLEQVSARFGVDPLLLTSLVGVETLYGNFTGRFVVFNAFYTIAVNFPGKAAWAENELSELLKLCYGQNLDVFSLKGSYAGAFGYGQFLPSTFNHYAVDFDGDGRKSWDAWPDSLATTANYLAASGYEPGTADFSLHSRDWWAIYAYNHSDDYVHALIDLRAAIKAELAKKP